MPDQAAANTVALFADLRLDVQDGGSAVAAHLHGGTDGLVLDVDRPVALGRVLGRQLDGARRMVLPAPALDLIRATPIELRSGGRDLGRLTFTAAGRARVRPTPAGVLTAAAEVLSSGRARVIAIGAGLALGTLAALPVLGSVRRRRSVAP